MTPPDLRDLRIGYAAFTPALNAPGDRRRFVHYARARGLPFELADPAKDYDVVVLSQRADISAWRRRSGLKLVFDFIDSYLAVPRANLKGKLRGLAKFVTGEHSILEFDYWRALEAMCSRADAVVCATEDQRRSIRPHNANVHIILDVHSSVADRPKQDYAPHRPFRIVWEGLASSVSQLATVAEALNALRVSRPIELHLITDLDLYLHLGRFGRRRTADVVRRTVGEAQLHPWASDTWGDIVRDCDLAVIPIDLCDPFTAGKPENKLLLFWRAGMPTLVSATPAYSTAMARAGLDMTCANTAEWMDKIAAYMDSQALRRDAGQRGLACARRDYSEADTLARWDAMFASILTPARVAASG